MNRDEYTAAVDSLPFSDNLEDRIISALGTQGKKKPAPLFRRLVPYAAAILVIFCAVGAVNTVGRSDKNALSEDSCDSAVQGTAEMQKENSYDLCLSQIQVDAEARDVMADGQPHELALRLYDECGEVMLPESLGDEITRLSGLGYTVGLASRNSDGSLFVCIRLSENELEGFPPSEQYNCSLSLPDGDYSLVTE